MYIWKSQVFLEYASRLQLYISSGVWNFDSYSIGLFKLSLLRCSKPKQSSFHDINLDFYVLWRRPFCSGTISLCINIQFKQKRCSSIFVSILLFRVQFYSRILRFKLRVKQGIKFKCRWLLYNILASQFDELHGPFDTCFL